MRPFDEHFDYESTHKGIDYAVRVGVSPETLTAECYFRFPPGHQFYGIPADQLDEELPDTVAAIYGQKDIWGNYWVGLEIAPQQFADSVVFAEAFLDGM